MRLPLLMTLLLAPLADGLVSSASAPNCIQMCLTSSVIASASTCVCRPTVEASVQQPTAERRNPKSRRKAKRDVGANEF
ncbi:hypothetical protein CA13_62440 [Planctomycetes bacterium CA13]|uniref:Extracellular membrane protein CFEM domain-containing protein n=1 Tax=Novipirellula herctigrandis TaxID=2527986 RepID=A0A5C5ZBS0_9BACT|nr:hypothetical protein CA13_62440 [Planctomycetes bacterium CA13]